MCADSGSREDVLHGHLTDDQLNAIVDDQLTPDERQQFDVHLANCPECREALSDLTVLSGVLSELPQHRVPRSFQLGPEHAKAPQSWVTRLANTLVPLLPAMRAGTIALALAFLGVTAARIVQDEPGSPASLISEETVQSADAFVPTDETAAGLVTEPSDTAPSATHETEAFEQVDAGPESTSEAPGPMVATDQQDFDEEASGGNDDRAASDTEPTLPPVSGAAGSDAAGEIEPLEAESAEMSDSAPADGDAADATSNQDETSVAESDEASDVPDVSAMKVPEEIASPMATPTVAESPVASPSPVTSPQAPAAVTSGEGESESWGRIQIVLAVLLGLMAVAVVGITRVARRSTG